MQLHVYEAARGNCKNVNRKSDKTVTDLDLTTEDNATRDSFRGSISRKIAKIEVNELSVWIVLF